MSAEPAARRATLVDAAEEALRDWLAPGRHRPGDRLPPEHDLAAMLGISRGTLRAALDRLEAAGAVVRRRGSGTFVGDLGAHAQFDAGLEVLESYASLARRQGVRLTVEDLELEHGPAGPEAERRLGLEPGTSSLVVERTLYADGRPAAWMRDVVTPELALPSDAAILRGLRRGKMLLDVLTDAGVPIAFARTEIQARLVGAPLGRRLGVRSPSAALELVETMHRRDGAAVQHSENVFAPGRLRLHVLRALRAGDPVARRPGWTVTPAG